ncbi:hypothetical protein M1D88_00725 [Arthrobacter sp. R1-13]
MTKQLHVSGRHVPWSLTLSVLCWLVPGVWSGLGTLIPSLLVPSHIRDSGWFGSGTLVVLAGYTVVVIGVPILMLYRSRVARALLSLVAGLFAIIVIAVPPIEPMFAFIPVALGAVLMWLPPSNQFLRKRIIAGNGAVL